MNKKERFIKAFNYIRSEGLIKTQTDLADKMGASRANVSTALKGDERVLTNNFLMRFSRTFPDTFHLEWLLTGEGSMLIRDMKDEPEEQPYNEPVNTIDQGSVINAMISSYNEHIEDLKKTIKQLNSQIEQKDIELAKKDSQIEQKDIELARKDEIIRNLSEALKKEREQTSYILPVGIAEEKPLIK